MPLSGSLQLPPVVIIPGAGGNQLEVQLTDDYKPASFLCCGRTRRRRRRWRWWPRPQPHPEDDKDDSDDDGYFRLWLDVPGLLPPFTHCFAQRMALVYNPRTCTCENTPGVLSRVPFFGSTRGMTYLDPSFRKLSLYMGVLVEVLEAEGYADGESLFGAPYDFRYAPGEYAAPCAVDFLKKLRTLIETAFTTNGAQPVVLLSHSLGGLWATYFLNQQTLEWRQKYVKHFIAVSTPWGGTVQVMRTYASGYAEGAPFVDPLVLRGEQRSSESNLWLLPVPGVFKEHILVSTKSRNYSASDMSIFLEDIGYSEGVLLYRSRIPPLINSLEAPGIHTTVIFSMGIRTPETLVYGNDGFDKQPQIMHGDGDGTVNLCSLSAIVDQWNSVTGQKLDVIKMEGKSHSSILSDMDSAQAIVRQVLAKNAHS